MTRKLFSMTFEANGPGLLAVALERAQRACWCVKGGVSTHASGAPPLDEQRASETVSGRLLLLGKGAACLTLVALLLRAKSDNGLYARPRGWTLLLLRPKGALDPRP